MAKNQASAEISIPTPPEPASHPLLKIPAAQWQAVEAATVELEQTPARLRDPHVA